MIYYFVQSILVASQGEPKLGMELLEWPEIFLVARICVALTPRVRTWELSGYCPISQRRKGAWRLAPDPRRIPDGPRPRLPASVE